MSYGIKQVAEMLNLTVSTIRYYDKEGLLPFIGRKESGYRVFSDTDIQLLRIIECLKKTGMQLKDIRKFVDYIKEGDNSLKERYDLFENRRKAVEAQIADLKKSLELIEYKCWYYKTAMEAGTESVHTQNCFDVKNPLNE
ncbi:MAG: MerR family transcriptional regulator [Candidatus Ornithomonoglobus sp.]